MRRARRERARVTRTRLGRLLGLLALLLGLSAVLAPAASAHTVGGGGASDFTCAVGPLTPPVPGVRVRPVEECNRIELTNRTGEQVVVLGYDGEPYLRVGPDGTFQNLLSQATYVNRDRYGGQTGGEIDAASKPPQWQRTGDGPTVLWHDHRAHYMGEPYPPVVRAAPGQRHVVSAPNTTIALQVGPSRQLVTAALTKVYVPPPPTWPWALLGVALAAGTVLLALPRRWPLLLAATTVGLVLSDAAHSAGIAALTAGSTAHRVSVIVTGNLAQAVAWLVGLVGAVLLARRRLLGAYAAGTAALLVAVVGGGGDLSTLQRSTAPVVGPLWWARLLVTVALGVGAGLIVACMLVVRRLEREQDRTAGPSGAGAGSLRASPPPRRPTRA